MSEFTLACGLLASILMWCAVWEFRQHHRRDARLLAALGATGAVSTLSAFLA